MNMRIVVNDIAASSGGAKTVLMDFYHYLVESNDKNEWIFLLGDLHLEETRYIKVINFPEIKRSKFKKYIREINLFLMIVSWFKFF